MAEKACSRRPFYRFPCPEWHQKYHRPWIATQRRRKKRSPRPPRTLNKRCRHEDAPGPGLAAWMEKPVAMPLLAKPLW